MSIRERMKGDNVDSIQATESRSSSLSSDEAPDVMRVVNKYWEERESKRDHARRLTAQWKPEGAWAYGFHDGWHSALNSNGDDREELFQWFLASKHVFCPCTSERACKPTCPHGNPIMSGSCQWCDNEFGKMVAEARERQANARNTAPTTESSTVSTKSTN